MKTPEIADIVKKYLKNKRCEDHDIRVFVRELDTHISILCCCDGLKARIEKELTILLGSEFDQERVRIY